MQDSYPSQESDDSSPIYRGASHVVGSETQYAEELRMWAIEQAVKPYARGHLSQPGVFLFADELIAYVRRNS